MKSKLAVLVGALLLAGSAYAQTNQVLSVNAVGYVKVDLIATNKIHMLRNDFVGLDSPAVISNVLASLPVGTQVILWDKGAQAYRPAFNKTVIGFGANGTNPLPRGQGFIVRTPSSATNVATIPLYILGEVPDSVTASTTTTYVVNGINLEGYPYPVSTKWTNTALSAALPVGSQVVIWNPLSQSYAAAINKTVIGWGPSGNALSLNPGQGYFVRTSTNVVVNQVKPYTWP
ncbi:MAG: hypothetical protein M9935_11315 [Kiritimatiellae bacterium]|nr:hypothetical protein [Kiritimatiellia bacterium]